MTSHLSLLLNKRVIELPPDQPLCSIHRVLRVCDSLPLSRQPDEPLAFVCESDH